MNFLAILWKNSNRNCWIDGLRWAGWAFGGALLPIWATVLILKLFAQSWSLSILYEHGEFAIYAAAFVSASLYTITKDFSKKRFPSQSALTLLSCLLLLAAALVYSVVQSVVLVPKIGSVVSIDGEILGVFGWFALPVSLVFGMLVVIVENIHLNADIEASREASIQKLNDEFDKLGDQSNE